MLKEQGVEYMHAIFVTSHGVYISFSVFSGSERSVLVSCQSWNFCFPPPAIVVTSCISSQHARALRADESPVASPGRSRVTPKQRATPKHHPPLEEAMEAGDEEIDWDHTRMVSLSFFPSISTDQVCLSGRERCCWCQFYC